MPQEVERWSSGLLTAHPEVGCIVHMHSDGDIRTLVDDLIEGGVQVINLQDLVNGIDWIAARFAGQTCIDLDVDRQSVTRFGTPAQIDAMLSGAVAAAERFYPAFQLVAWGDDDAAAALVIAMAPSIGRA